MAGGYVRVKGRGRLWRVWVGLMAAVVFLACCGRMRVQAAAAQAGDVKEFVGRYYDAWALEDSSALWEYYGDGQDDPGKIRIQALFEVMQEWGIVRDIHSIEVYSMEQPNWWVAVVAYDLIIEGIAFPGCECLVIYMQEDSSGLIYNNNDVDSAVMDEITHFMQGDEEILEKMNETNKEYYEVLTEHPEAYEWLLDLEQAITQRTMEIINGEEESKKPEESEESEASGGELYVVQKGDCLWHIAEAKLGSGARWVDLYEANRDIIGEDPNLILIDMELRIQ